MGNSEKLMFDAIRHVLSVSSEQFGGRLTLKQITMFLAVGRRQSGDKNAPRYTRDELQGLCDFRFGAWDRPGHGMIRRYGRGWRLTVKGERAFQAISEAAKRLN